MNVLYMYVRMCIKLFFILTDYRSVAKDFSPSQTYIPWPLYERCHHTKVRDSNVIALHMNLYCLMRVHLGPTLRRS